MKQINRMIGFLAIAFLAAFSVQALPAAPAGLSGHWDGSIVLPSMKLEIKLDFGKKADGAWKGDISIPVQNIKDMALANIKADGTAASFDIPGIPRNPAFSPTNSCPSSAASTRSSRPRS